MHDACCMRRRHRLHDLHEQREALLEISLPPCPLQLNPVDPIQHEERNWRFHRYLIHRTQVGMAQAGHGAGFGEHAILLGAGGCASLMK